MSYSKYPGQIDSSTELPVSTDNVTPVKAEVVNRLRDSVLAVENELGVNPSGLYGTVVDRLQAMSNAIGIGTGSKGGGSIYWQPGGTSSGSVVATWAEVMTALTTSTSGFDCIVDTTLGSAIIPAGTYDTKGIIRFKSYRDGISIGAPAHATVIVQFAQGALVKNLAPINSAVVLQRLGSNVILSWDAVNPGNTVPIFGLNNGASLIDAGPGPGTMISIPGGTSFAFILNSNISTITPGGGSVVNVGSGGTCIVLASNGFNLKSNWITSTDATASLQYEFDGTITAPTLSGFPGSVSRQELFTPNWSTTGRPTTKNGVVGLNTNLGTIEFYNSGTWSSLITSGGDIGGTPTIPVVTAIQAIPISSSAPSNGNVLAYNGSQWAPGTGFTAAGDLGGNSTSQTVIAFQGKSISTTAPTSNQELVWNSGTTKWTPTDRLAPTKIIFPGVAGLQQTTNTGATEIGATLFDPSAIYSGSAYTRTIKAIIELEVNTAGETATLVLYDITDGVTIHTFTSTSTTPFTTSATLTVSAAGADTLANSSKLYGWRLSRSGATNLDPVTCKMAYLEVTYS